MFAYFLLLTTHYSLLTTYHLLFIIHYLHFPYSLLTTYYQVSGEPQLFGTIDLPNQQDSYTFYTGRMPVAGEFVGVDWHSHMLKFQALHRPRPI